jgi:spore germination protein GerM
VKRVLALALLVICTGCSRGVEVRLIDKANLPQELYGNAPERNVEPQTVRVLIYFVRTDSSGKFLRPVRLGAVGREVVTRLSPVEVAIRFLLQGPTPAERKAGFASAIQAGTELIGVTVEDGVADVNLSAEFEAVTSQLGHLMKISQVVWTLTELPEVEAVRFRIHGVPQPVIDQNGVAHERVGQGRYSRFAPRHTDDSGVIDGSVGPVTTAEP